MTKPPQRVDDDRVDGISLVDVERQRQYPLGRQRDYVGEGHRVAGRRDEVPFTCQDGSGQFHAKARRTAGNQPDGVVSSL